MNLQLLLLTFLFSLNSLAQGDWPRFRGPNGTGIAEGNPPAEWSSKKNLLWKSELPGPGSSSPIIHGTRIFVACYSSYGDGSEGELKDLKRHLVCIDRDSGKILWDKTTPLGAKEDPYTGFLNEHGYASNTPVTDGKAVYAFFGKAGLVAYDYDGNEIWRKAVGTYSGGKVWGSAASPVLFEDLLIVNQHDEDRALVAYDKKTGEEKWRIDDRRMDLAFGTPVLFPNGDQTDLLLAIPGEAWGINPKTGKGRWWRSIPITGNLSASPLFSGKRVVLFGGYPRTIRVAFDVEGEGDLSSKPLAWENTRAAYLQTPVLIEDRLHWVSDDGFARCAALATGDLIYDERLPNAVGGGSRGKPFYSSPILAGNRIYMVSRNQGTFVLEAGKDFKILAQNKLDDESRFNATPAVFGDQILLRSQTHLYCIGEK